MILSLFPGIGILDHAFELEGFTVVRGPDLLWGGDIRRFHVPAGRFEGVVGGTPGQAFSSLVALVRHNGHTVAQDLIPEFERVVWEAQPEWFLMENVIGAPLPCVAGYKVDPTVLDNRWLGNIQSRLHRFSFGTRDGRRLYYATEALESPEFATRVMATHDALPKPRRRGDALVTRTEYAKGRRYRSIAECCELQGLPADFFKHSPFTRARQRQMLGNAVPLPMGRVVARAIRAALGLAVPADKPASPGSGEAGQGSRVSVDTRSAGVPSLPARAGCVAAGQASQGGT